MATSYQRDNGSWRVAVELERDDDGRRRRRYFDAPTEDEAYARMAEAYPDPIMPKAVGADEWEQLWNAVADHAEAKQVTDSDVTEATFDWGNEPVGLLLWSDWHIGSSWCDYDQLREDVDYVADYRRGNPGALRLAHLGDLVDNYRASGPHPTGLHETVETRTDKQRGLALWLAKQAGTWDAMLLGCHLAWNLTHEGDDVLAPIAASLGAVNGGYGLDMTITVGSQTYRGLIRHKPKGGGGMAPGNAQRRLDNEYGPAGDRADFISTSHQHTCHLESYEKAGRHVTFTRSGGYKGGDCFARAGAFTHDKSSDNGVPLLVLHPDRHDIQAFDGHHWKDGLRYLALLRAEYRKSKAA